MRPVKLNNARVLMYSHDTYGLGHLRRCQTIAHWLVKRFKGLSVLIVTGSPIIGRFEFRARVDFVRIPGVIKLVNGEYTPLRLHINLEETLRIRESIIFHTAKAFHPDLFLVDKEPLGLQGEVENTLKMLRKQGTRLVLGLRDVLDDLERLQAEWARKKILEKLPGLFDEIWVYGAPAMGNPLDGLSFSRPLTTPVVMTGYLERRLPVNHTPLVEAPCPKEYLLVTPGGGGDAAEMIDRVLETLGSCSPPLAMPVVIVLGPFMPTKLRQQFQQRAAGLPRVTTRVFESRLESLISNASGVVAMGGYNTFCELISFNKPALLIPRKTPRLEQFIRSQRAARLGLATMLDPDTLDNRQLANALRYLPHQPRPKSALPSGFFAGLTVIEDKFLQLMGARGQLM
jgi:predicted glycosyltransferase